MTAPVPCPECARLREALEHYADENRWVSRDRLRCVRSLYVGKGDGYDVARAALADPDAPLRP